MSRISYIKKRCVFRLSRFQTVNIFVVKVYVIFLVVFGGG